MKNSEVIEIYRNLERISKGTYKGIEFSFAVLKNKKVFKEYVDTLQETVKPSEEFLEYEKARIDLLKELSTDESGEVKTRDIGGGNIEYLILEENKDKFQKKLASLKKKHKTSIDEHDKKVESYNDFLSKDATIEAVTISKGSLPDDLKITDLEGIFELIED